MKAQKALFLFIIVVLFVVCGCKGSSTEPDLGVTIVRFKEPAYINNLLVYENKGKDHFSLTRGNKCEHSYWQMYPTGDKDGSILGATDEVNFTESHRYPFWALPDGWYLIDWAWGNLAGDSPYPYIENVVLTDVTYENFYDIGPDTFDKSLPHIILTAKNMYEKKFIKLKDIIAHAPQDNNHPPFELHYYNTISDTEIIFSQTNQEYFHMALGKGDLVVASNVSDCLCNHADQMDEYWALLQNQLTALINNGYLNKK